MNSASSISLKHTSPYAKELIRHFLPAAVLCHRDQKKCLLVDNSARRCYLVLEGSVSLHRLADDLLIGITNTPTIFGLTGVLSEATDLYLRPATNAQVASLPTEVAYEIIYEKGLWQPVALYMAHLLSKMYLYSQHLTMPTAYEIVRYQLIELSNESVDYRQHITAAHYIQAKTHLSRSGIMKILAELRKGKYIEMENGRLIRINTLPAKY